MTKFIEGQVISFFALFNSPTIAFVHSPPGLKHTWTGVLLRMTSFAFEL